MPINLVAALSFFRREHNPRRCFGFHGATIDPLFLPLTAAPAITLVLSHLVRNKAGLHAYLCIARVLYPKARRTNFVPLRAREASARQREINSSQELKGAKQEPGISIHGNFINGRSDVTEEIYHGFIYLSLYVSASSA